MRSRPFNLALAAWMGTLAVSGCGGSAKPREPGASAPLPAIVFTSVRDGNEEIFVMNADGSWQTRLTTTDTSTMNIDPSWAPDGSRIAFARYLSPFFQVFVVKPDGSGLAQLTSTPTDKVSPTWSPDGAKIAFSAGASIGVMNADGTGETLVTSHAVGDYSNDWFPSWSPDGKRLLFASDRAVAYRDEVYAMDVDGSNMKQLTTQAAAAGGSTLPSWSPDGSHIAFINNDSGNFEIYRMSADGTGKTRLTTTAAHNAYPSWSSDGSKLVFSSDRSGAWEILVMNADGSGLTTLTSGTAGGDKPCWRSKPR